MSDNEVSVPSTEYNSVKRVVLNANDDDTVLLVKTNGMGGIPKYSFSVG